MMKILGISVESDSHLLSTRLKWSVNIEFEKKEQTQYQRKKRKKKHQTTRKHTECPNNLLQEQVDKELKASWVSFWVVMVYEQVGQSCQGMDRNKTGMQLIIEDEITMLILLFLMTQ